MVLMFLTGSHASKHLEDRLFNLNLPVDGCRCAFEKIKVLKNEHEYLSDSSKDFKKEVLYIYGTFPKMISHCLTWFRWPFLRQTHAFPWIRHHAGSFPAAVR